MLHSFERFDNYSFIHTFTAHCIYFTYFKVTLTAKSLVQIKKPVFHYWYQMEAWQPSDLCCSRRGLSRLQPVSVSHVLLYHWSKIEICSQCAPRLSANQDERKRRGERKMRKMEKKIVNVTEPWKSWPGVWMIRYTRFFSAVASGINITYISPSLVQEISSPGTDNLNT